ncbi:MAG: nucleotidyltransferase [Desulfuromonadales bacterium]|nr:nucleotidyltransferase [Desulfuromonadales bacterium]
MRIVGLITEYNPFHNGHLHHLRESLRITVADASVAVMSGHFLQRGEPALVDKWVRTEMALAAGVDLVLELPFPFACNSAPHFAMGAVQTLDALGVVDALCFGSETGVIDPLQTIARLLIERSDAIEDGTRERLRCGVSYPVARAEVMTELYPNLSPETLASPNNILGIEYLRALQITSSQMHAFTIPRLGADYHSTEVLDDIASATGIRKLIAEGDKVDHLLPAPGHEILKEALAEGRYLDRERLFTALQSFLLQEPERLKGLCQVTDGLDKRLIEAAMTAESYTDLVALIKSRQWTLTRIQRILSYVLLQLSATEMVGFLESGPLYLRLLGATEQGRKVLANARKKRSLPLISDPSRARATLRRFYQGQPARCQLAERMLNCDLRATRIYGLLQATQQRVHRNQDFFRPVQNV